MGWIKNWRNRRWLEKSEAHGPRISDEAIAYFKAFPPDDPIIDFDREIIPVDDDSDPTSLLMNLAMMGEAVHVAWDDKQELWVVKTESKTWTGRTQMVALNKAVAELRKDNA